MKQLLKILVIVFFLMGSGLLIWTIIPQNRVEKVFTIDPNYSLFYEKMKCGEVNNLLGTDFTVIYPRSIWSGEPGFVQVDIEKGKIDENKTNKVNELAPCEISLEVWIDGRGMVVEPGNKIIKPYLNVPSQSIKFDIFLMYDQSVKGTIWISAVFTDNIRSVLERTPMFAVPYTIQVHSLFGLSARSVRILSVCIIILALALGIIQKESEREPK